MYVHLDIHMYSMCVRVHVPVCRHVCVHVCVYVVMAVPESCLFPIHLLMIFSSMYNVPIGLKSNDTI